MSKWCYCFLQPACLQSSSMRLAEAGALVSKAVVPEACVPALAATFLVVCALPQDPMKSAHPASPDSKPWGRPDRTVFTSARIRVHTCTHTYGTGRNEGTDRVGLKLLPSQECPYSTKGKKACKGKKYDRLDRSCYVLFWSVSVKM